MCARTRPRSTDFKIDKISVLVWLPRPAASIWTPIAHTSPHAKGSVVMSLARLSAGSGYRYLLRHTACCDVERDVGTPLTAYYTASGYPPGRWIGRGLAGLNEGRGLSAGTVVTEEAMAALYGSGRDPVTGSPLGRPYLNFKPVEQRIADQVARLPGDLSEQERAERVAEIEAAERARPLRAAVAGFDLTFTVPKSASVLWALGDPPTQRAVAEAHREAVDATLDALQDRWLFTRTGAGSCAQVPTRGMVAACFDHWDTRTGDPNLHTHVVIANKVQGEDGLWRSLDSRALHHAAVSVSELYDDFLADALAAKLPVSWGWRPRGERRTPAFELDGLDDPLLAAFSTRSDQIDEHLRDALADFMAAHGRRPNRPEMLRLRQQATKATRPPKSLQPLAGLMARWRETASRLTGRSPEQITAAALRRRPWRRFPADQIGPDLLDLLTERTLAGAGARRSTWTRPNLVAEAARASRGLRMVNAGERLALIDKLVKLSIDRCVPLDPPELVNVPERFRRPDGSSVFTRPDEHAYTTEAILAAEDRLLAAADTVGAPAVDAQTVDTITAGRADGTRHRRLTTDQVSALRTVATSGRRLDVLIGPAGTGKTTTLQALREAWGAAHGPGSVLGLAPSATAAQELAEALGIGCENTAKWLHESTGVGAQQRAELLHALDVRAQQGRPTSSASRRIDQARGELEAEQARWTLRAGQLLIVDEASMASTATLDELVRQAGERGAKVLLVGDHHQLDAVDAGGAFRLLSETGNPATLTALWRFRHRWEAAATRLLRAGHPAALDAYENHGRLHDGPAEAMLDAAYTAWRDDQARGRSSLLIAPDTQTVTALNTRAHDDQVLAGHVHPGGVRLGDGTSIGPGDRIVTRHNDRRLRLPSGGHVRNGALWQVSATHDDGSLSVAPLHRTGAAESSNGSPLRLPPEYVAEHVELGYASTIHRAQGMTVEHSRVLVHPGMTRQALYVALTRGRTSNHAYVAVDDIDPACPHPPDTGGVHSGRQILETVLATDGAELSATQTLRQRQDAAASLATLVPIRDTLTAAAARDRWQPLLPRCGLSADQAAAVLASPAAGALFAALDAGAALGYPMARVLPSLVAQRPLDHPDDPARDLAAVLRARVTDWLQNTETAQAASHGGVDALIGRNRIDAVDLGLRQAIRDLDALVEARLDDLLQRPDNTWTDALGRPPDDPADRAEWKRHARTVAAYHDLTTPAKNRSHDPRDQAAERRRRLLAQQASTAAQALTTPDHERTPYP
jgi:conjugative relaxase-like TrwC/TraI family protein